MPALQLKFSTAMAALALSCIYIYIYMCLCVCMQWCMCKCSGLTYLPIAYTSLSLAGYVPKVIATPPKRARRRRARRRTALGLGQGAAAAAAAADPGVVVEDMGDASGTASGEAGADADAGAPQLSADASSDSEGEEEDVESNSDESEGGIDRWDSGSEDGEATAAADPGVAIAAQRKRRATRTRTRNIDDLKFADRTSESRFNAFLSFQAPPAEPTCYIHPEQPAVVECGDCCYPLRVWLCSSCHAERHPSSVWHALRRSSGAVFERINEHLQLPDLRPELVPDTCLKCDVERRSFTCLSLRAYARSFPLSVVSD